MLRRCEGPADLRAAASWRSLRGTPPVPAPLTKGGTNATAEASWSAAVDGETKGSTTMATSCDAASLTVSGERLSGMFSFAGDKTITITGTLDGAGTRPTAALSP